MKQSHDRPRLVEHSAHKTSTLRVLAIALCLRIFAAMLPHSGQGKAPNYGDFEAQRHWMEITTQLPISQWYFYDPEWWPLDYPPMSAYHSWVLGKIGSLIDPSWFALYASRGCEETGLKIFMRVTVIVSELLVFVPAVLYLVRRNQHQHLKSRIAMVAVILQPAIILVDHGHFQYNTVMLGLFVAAVGSFLSDYDLLGCVFFVAALGFKQMALFYAPAVAAYLAGTCLFPRIRPFRLLAIAAVTISSFVMLYAPFILDTWSGISLKTTSSADAFEMLASWQQECMPLVRQIGQSLHRIFPFQRGLFEDKVANIWCSIHFSGLYKMHHSADMLQLIALASTMLMILPPCLIIFFRPRKNLIIPAFTACAWGFFLCSYQVHEKNVLLPLVPMTALLASKYAERAAIRAWVGFANIVATWSLYHLLIKDDLQLAYWPILGTWMYLMELPPFNLGLYRVSFEQGGLLFLEKCLHLATYATIVLWHIAQCTIPAPVGKPDLWIVLSMICSCVAFCCCYLWCLSLLVVDSGLAKDARRLAHLCLKRSPGLLDRYR